MHQAMREAAWLLQWMVLEGLSEKCLHCLQHIYFYTKSQQIRANLNYTKHHYFILASSSWTPHVRHCSWNQLTRLSVPHHAYFGRFSPLICIYSSLPFSCFIPPSLSASPPLRRDTTLDPPGTATLDTVSGWHRVSTFTCWKALAYAVWRCLTWWQQRRVLSSKWGQKWYSNMFSYIYRCTVTCSTAQQCVQLYL